MGDGELKKRVLILFPPGINPDFGVYRYSLGKDIDEAKKDILPSNKIKKMLNEWDNTYARIIIVPDARCYERGTIEVEEEEYVEITDEIKKWFGDSS